MSKLVVDATGNDLTYRIIGAAMTVHNKVGSGYKEEIYERALKNEFISQEIEVADQFPLTVEVDGEQVGLFYLDLLVEGQVVVEIKSIDK
jgi:GxxExxY protein